LRCITNRATSREIATRARARAQAARTVEDRAAPYPESDDRRCLVRLQRSSARYNFKICSQTKNGNLYLAYLAISANIAITPRSPVRQLCALRASRAGSRPERARAVRAIAVSRARVSGTGRATGPAIPGAIIIYSARRPHGLEQAATSRANTRSQARSSQDDPSEITSNANRQYCRTRRYAQIRPSPTRHDIASAGRPVGFLKNVSCFFLRAPNHPTLCESVAEPKQANDTWSRPNDTNTDSSLRRVSDPCRHSARRSRYNPKRVDEVVTHAIARPDHALGTSAVGQARRASAFAGSATASER
jgi:hypothetical protein